MGFVLSLLELRINSNLTNVYRRCTFRSGVAVDKKKQARQKMNVGFLVREVVIVILSINLIGIDTAANGMFKIRDVVLLCRDNFVEY